MSTSQVATLNPTDSKRRARSNRVPVAARPMISIIWPLPRLARAVAVRRPTPTPNPDDSPTAQELKKQLEKQLIPTNPSPQEQDNDA